MFLVCVGCVCNALLKLPGGVMGVPCTDMVFMLFNGLLK